MRIAFASEAFRQLNLPPSFAIKPRQPLLCGGQFGLGHPPFGFNPGLIGGGLRQRQFGGAKAAVSLAQRGGDVRLAGFLGAQRALTSGQIAFQLGQGFGGIAGQPVCIAAVFLEPLVLTLQICQPLLRGFKLAAQRGHAVAVRGGIVAAIGQYITRFG